MTETKISEKTKVKIRRFCVHCFHEWDEEATRIQLKKILEHEAIGICPNPRCEMPT